MTEKYYVVNWKYETCSEENQCIVDYNATSGRLREVLDETIRSSDSSVFLDEDVEELYDKFIKKSLGCPEPFPITIHGMLTIWSE